MYTQFFYIIKHIKMNTIKDDTVLIYIFILFICVAALLLYFALKFKKEVATKRNLMKEMMFKKDCKVVANS